MTMSRRRSAPRARGLLDALELSFLDALRTPDGSEAPAALLWADPDRQWADLVARLQLALPPDGFCRFGLELGDWLLIDDEASVVDGFCWAPWPNVSKRIDLLAEATGTLGKLA